MADASPSRKIWAFLRRHARTLIIVAGLCALGVAFAFLWPRRPVRVDVVRSDRASLISTVVATGTVEAPITVSLGVEIAGVVEDVAVSEGDSVAQGDVLLRLSNEGARAAIAEAEARVEEAEAQLRRLRATEARVALASEAAARADLRQASREVTRLSSLVDAGAATERELTRAEQAREVAAAEVSRAETRVRSASRGGSDVAVAIASLRRAIAARASAEVALSLGRVVAPADGTIVERRVDPGAIVRGGEHLLDLAHRGPPRITIEPDETALRNLRVGQRGQASAEAFPNRSFDTVVQRIAPAVDVDRGTLRVELGVPEPPAYLRQGMTVSVEIEVDRAEDTPTLPVAAVHDIGREHPFVFELEEGRARKRAVRIGIRGERMCEIVEGVGASAEILIHPSRPLEDGVRVRVRPGGGD